MRITQALVLAALSGFPALASIAGAQSDSALPPHPVPGQLIDVGGWRLHHYCTGVPQPGQPTVILEAGVGAFSVEWALVQPQVAEFARVCSYDRAGSGWSEWGPHPRTLRQVVSELHTLLRRSGEQPPFVLVGASYGGWVVRLYQLTNPAEVAGLVLVDPGVNDPARLMPDGRVVRSSSLSRDRLIPPVKTSGPLREADIPPAALAQIRAGLASASAHANEPPRDKLPRAAQEIRSWALGRVGHVVAAVNPFEPEELAELRALSARETVALSALPLIVITRGIADESGEGAAEREVEHRRDHASQAAQSRRGQLLVAERSGHHVPLDDPALVSRTIRDLLNSTRR
jgi:pimeloyl-ACP methyl ester carboxylesterase